MKNIFNLTRRNKWEKIASVRTFKNRKIRNKKLRFIK